jgi:hypothetical protein
MDSESRKTYNKNYYLENKEILQEKMKIKINCIHCNRAVQKGAIESHMRTSICKRKAMSNASTVDYKDLLDKMKAMMTVNNCV